MTEPLFALPPEMIEYAFPLRPDLLLRLELPVDLTDADVDRLSRFLRALVFARELPALPAPAPELPPAPPALPPAPPRLQPKVYVVAGGGGDLLDLWSTALHAPESTRAHDAPRIVSGEIEPWEVLEAFAAAPPHAGQFGGGLREGDEIVSFRQRARTVLIQSQGVAGVLVDNDPEKAEWKVGGAVNVRPINIKAFAPAGTRIFRVAWACASQALKLGPHDKLPASTCSFQLSPTEAVTELAFYYALWVG